MSSGVSRSGIRIYGFTLVEVLAALVIVSLGMLGVIEAVSQTASNASYLREKTLAHWIAMNRLAEVRLAPRPPNIDESNGEVEFAGADWRWEMNVTQTAVESMRRIDITVRREDSPEGTSLAAITGFYGAAVTQPGMTSTQAIWMDRTAPPGSDDGGEDGRDRGRDEDNGGEPPADDPGDGGVEPVDPPIPEVEPPPPNNIE